MKAIGIDLGATNVRVALGDNEGNISKKITELTDITKGANGVAQQLIRLIDSFQIDCNALEGIGIGSMGPLDIQRGAILVAPNLPFNDIPLKEPIEKAFECPAQVLNDCSAAVLGEKMFGLGKQVDNLVYITISSGVGCGAYEGGRLILGEDGNAAEMGHTVIDMSGALVCGCGLRGHWEAYCSGNNIPHYVKLWINENNAQTQFEQSRLATLSNSLVDNITTKMVYDSAKAGDAFCLKMIEQLGRLNAMGIANVIAAYNPELITIGGSVALNNQKLVLEPIKKFIEEFSINRVPTINITPLGHDIVLYGALAMNFQEI
jgi:glucokinase